MEPGPEQRAGTGSSLAHLLWSIRPGAALNKQPMRLRKWLFSAVPLVALLATGCSPVADPGGPTAETAAEPPKTQTAMVCETEVEDEIATALDLPTSQPLSSTWSDKLFTCTYHYGEAVMLVSVKELADAAAASRTLLLTTTSSGEQPRTVPRHGRRSVRDQQRFRLRP